MIIYKKASISLIFLTLCACNNEIVRENKPVDEGAGVSQIVKSDIDNVLDVHIQESKKLLRELMVKLYKRNPRELKKSELKLIEGSWLDYLILNILVTFLSFKESMMSN